MSKHGMKNRILALLLMWSMLLFTGCSSLPQNEGETGSREMAESQEAFGISLDTEEKAASETEVMEVHFLDVGQGDTILITCGGESMLIDTSTDDKGTAIQNYLTKHGVERLNYLVLTHPDSDHIGAAPVIITKFEIDHVLMSDFEKDNNTYRKLIQALDDKLLKPEYPQAGSTFQIGSAVCTVIGPNKTYEDPNNASIALRIENGENSFLFTGDAEEEAEEDMIAAGFLLDADVYKAGHHGSRSSSGEEFLDLVSPSAAVISCGEDNSYGHPHAQTLNRLRERGVSVYRTDEQGTIIASSDGTQITWNTAPSDSWKAGEPTGSAAGGGREEQAGEAGAQPQEPSGSVAGDSQEEQAVIPQQSTQITYVLNVESMKFHNPSCSYLPTKNRQDTSMSREEVIAAGYDPCGRCKP